MEHRPEQLHQSERKYESLMNMSTRYLQLPAQTVVAQPMQAMGEQKALVQNPEINRLLTAAVVNRRFCRLLLTNPLAALTLGYRGESFRLNPTEVHRVSAIRATSLRDFALQLLVDTETTVDNKYVYESYPQSVMMLLPSSGA